MFRCSVGVDLFLCEVVCSSTGYAERSPANPVEEKVSISTYFQLQPEIGLPGRSDLRIRVSKKVV